MTAARLGPHFRMPVDRRQVNDFRQQFFGGEERLIAYVCECADPNCRRAVRLTPTSFADLRRTDGFVLSPGHMPIEDTPLAAEAAAAASDLHPPSETPSDVPQLPAEG
jgi:hypothetical protein